MSVLVATFDGDNRVTSWRYEADDGYTADADEVILTDADHRELDGSTVDPGTGALSADPEAHFTRPGVVDGRTREIIASQFQAKGSDAITAANDIAGNGTIPQEVSDFADAVMALQYLTYVALTGTRHDAVESRFFP